MSKTAKKVRNRYEGKRFHYRGGIILARENLGLIYENNDSAYYDCKVIEKTNNGLRVGSKIELRYQVLRILAEAA
jgi:hypothetical protein